jgi:hypothetical protein
MINYEDYVTYNMNTIKSLSSSPHKSALLLTTYNSKEMEHIYINTIKWWIENSNFDIYVVNSSGKFFDLDFDCDRLTIFTFNQDDYAIPGKSTTYYELLSIRKILEYIPSILVKYTCIIKLTGKYRLPSLEKMIRKIPQNIDIIFQHIHIGKYSQNTEVIGFKSDQILDIIKYAQYYPNLTFERIMSNIKQKKYITLRLDPIHIPKEYRVLRRNNSILKIL